MGTLPHANLQVRERRLGWYISRVMAARRSVNHIVMSGRVSGNREERLRTEQVFPPRECDLQQC